jgi:tetratricopeptide (TPR) repeat protein
MAVIYAQQNQYEKAKQALESALRTDPAYATAHENLGDIYIHMASQAYDKALQTNSANAAQPAKLAMIRQLADARPTPSDRPTQILAMAESKPGEVPQSKPAAASQPEPKAAEPASTKPVEPKPVQVADNAITEATTMVHAWAAAWSKKDVKAYLAFYARDFRTPNGQSRPQWEKERAQRINKPGAIAVAIANLSVKQNGPDQATAYFRQHYQSASLNTLSNKALTLVRHNGRWLILQEQVGR